MYLSLIVTADYSFFFKIVPVLLRFRLLDCFGKQLLEKELKMYRLCHIYILHNIFDMREIFVSWKVGTFFLWIVDDFLNHYNVENSPNIQ